MGRINWNSVLTLVFLQYANYFLLTLNYRAVATMSYSGTLVSDVLIALISFSTIRRVANATTAVERVAYVLGGVVGAQQALLLSSWIF